LDLVVHLPLAPNPHFYQAGPTAPYSSLFLKLADLLIMLPAQFHALVQSLGLTQGLFKPCPSHFNVSQHATQSVSSKPGSYVQPPKTAQQAYNSTAWMNSRAQDVIDSRQDACYVEPYYPPPPTEFSFEPFDEARATIYRFRQQQSVNLGSWFVHESWMTPSLFRCASGPQVSEIDIAFGWGSPESARNVLERHWDTFITQSDFDYLASIGINTVRLPIGYWSLGPGFTVGTPFEPVSEVYSNAWSRVVRAINMAGRAGLGVLVDLHGAVGSQNGQPHSGISDGQINLFTNPTNTALTIRVLVFLTQQLAYVTNVVGIQILNEPQYVPELESFCNYLLHCPLLCLHLTPLFM
jgi:glucan 1,3-beta-glucosidase